jgi:hypothetical protein
VLTRQLSRRLVLAGAGAAAASVIVLSGCGGNDSSVPSDRPTGAGPRRGGVLTFAVNSSSASEKLDPLQANGPPSYLRNAAVFDTLTALRERQRRAGRGRGAGGGQAAHGSRRAVPRRAIRGRAPARRSRPAFAAPAQSLALRRGHIGAGVSVQATILELIAELTATFTTTVVLVSHDLAVARTIRRRVVVLKAGRICEDGPTDDVFSAPAHPHTRELIESIRAVA